ncbi:MAG: hypothetical protein AMXMBFR84_32280 [Candidatus Hydrogenedentota bacterium]
MTVMSQIAAGVAVLVCGITYPDTVPGQIVLYPDGHYVLPDGESVYTNGSKTSGLQEAVNRCVKDNLDLFVSGGDYKSRVYSCSESLVFPPMQGKVIRFGSATLNFDGFADRSQPGLLFDSCMNVQFECHAQIVYHLEGPAVRFEPKGNLPVDDFVGPTLIASRFKFAAISHVNTPVHMVGKDGGIPRDNLDAACMVIAPTHSITRCEFDIVELLGGNTGIRVDTPSGSGSFAFNHVKALFAHEQFHTSVMEGTKPGDPANDKLRGNQWNVHCAPAPGAGAVQVHGTRGSWVLNVVAEKGALKSGLETFATTSGNHFQVLSLDGSISGPFHRENPGSNRFN